MRPHPLVAGEDEGWMLTIRPGPAGDEFFGEDAHKAGQRDDIYGAL